MENIKEIADMIVKLGIQGKQAFMLYLLIDFGRLLIGCATCLLVVKIVFNTILKGIASYSLADEICRRNRWSELNESRRRSILKVVKHCVGYYGEIQTLSDTDLKLFKEAKE